MIKEWLLLHNIPFLREVSLKSKTWIKRGGIADYWITPENKQQLATLVYFLYQNNIFFEVVGSTSNLYFFNDYNPKCVISTTSLNGYSIEEDLIICDCGVLISRLAADCIERGIAGYEGFNGLPGTVGGAVYNNSSCFGCEIAVILESISIITSDGQQKIMSAKDMEYFHRDSILKSKKIKGVILSANFKREYTEDVEVLKAKSKNNRNYRNTYQQGYHQNLGSTYAVLEHPKWSIRYLLSLILIKCMLWTENDISKIKYNRKMIFLWIYGYLYLKDYISDHNLNCFVWKDEKADELFKLYDIFLGKIYKIKKLEIEIKESR